MKDTLWKNISTLFVKPILSRYLRKERRVRSNGFFLTVRPTVFHPKFFFSSQYLFDFTKKLDMEGKSFLEIGCGSGLISLLAYQKKAEVTGVDLNPEAVECTKINFAANFKEPIRASILLSDVFQKVPEKRYDFVLINPPYFFSDVQHQSQMAWNCGQNGEYFVKLFSGITQRKEQLGQVFMILADNCEIDRIKNLAEQRELSLHLIEKKKIRWETNFIFSVVWQ